MTRWKMEGYKLVWNEQLNQQTPTVETVGGLPIVSNFKRENTHPI